ncbi:hypothetical protein [Streptomyces xanthochromogenes]|uniref:hypothetical protein n=1 Tax=Streptomyces xanthochromogenes TaxID=67384 RepID=UPI00167A76F4|nr:hypothetical protein [Streptomyces xanthochromogenes]
MSSANNRIASLTLNISFAPPYERIGSISRAASPIRHWALLIAATQSRPSLTSSA